jgi:hypothetical protein
MARLLEVCAQLDSQKIEQNRHELDADKARLELIVANAMDLLAEHLGWETLDSPPRK